ncbi:hypothetical protein FRUB_06007 [Fimbriiglobus ruber]|uniref:Peptidase C14 caspase domain-containing protein n=1 Tax=Fimbriiglobus ruber TaxID=1908690 RepID=A0A225DIC4_9BACT|nr:hypothetical protein FRUB_06007 [Fimbriiglobus ruber]
MWAGFGVVMVGIAIACAANFTRLKTAFLGKTDQQVAGSENGGNTTTPGTQKSTAPAGPGAGTGIKSASIQFPRRMLVMNASKYLYCNSLAAGKSHTGGDQVSEVAKRLAFEWRVPQDPGNNQLFVLDDTSGKTARPMLKSIIEQTYEQFCETSRPQDHVFIYFGGHATEKEGKAYLVPVDGDLSDAATLVPLDDFWAKVKDCKAQQKVVVFDVCRLNEDGDQVRPGSEALSEGLEKALTSPPAGVQVVTTCSMGQNALEYRRNPQDAADVIGSLFLSTMKYVADKGKAKPAKPLAPDDPLPIGQWVDAAKVRMKEVAGLTMKGEQVPKLTGSEPGSAVAFNAEEAAAKRFEFPTPPKGLAPTEIAKITKIIDLPPIRQNTSGDEEPIETLIPFTEEAMKDYKTDMSEEDIKKDPEKYKVRIAALDTLEAIRKVWTATQAKDGSSGLRETFTGDSNDAVKKQIIAEQETPARIILELDERVKAMEMVMGDLEKEESKFWKATFQYTLAQAKARLAFMNEYNLSLGNIRTDSLPMKDEKKGQTGLQLVSQEKMKSKKDVKDLAEDAKKLFAELAKESKDTPWGVVAHRNKVLALGLDWKAFAAAGTGIKD